MLQNTLYTGTMEQGRAPRAGMHGKATKLDPSQWVVVPATHEAIIPPDQWEPGPASFTKKGPSADLSPRGQSICRLPNLRRLRPGDVQNPQRREPPLRLRVL